MPVVELRRSSPLTAVEQSRLPAGCDKVDHDGDLIARAAAPSSPADLVAFAVLVARAVPDARVAWVEMALLPPPAPPENASAAPDPSGNPWELLSEGDVEAAVAILEGQSLDSEGRAAVRTLLQDTDPARVAAGCRVARATGWRSSVSSIRRLLGHGDTRVRLAAVEAVGVLAGPGLVPALERVMGNDASPEVRAAATAAIVRLEGTDGPD